MRRQPWIGLVVAIALVAAACGSRTTPAQQAAARGRTVGVAAGSSPTAGAGSDAGSSSQPSVGGGSSTGAGGPAASTAVGPGTAGTATGGQVGGPTAATQPGACQNKGATAVGVTGQQITLGNVASLSGPVPGLFQGAQVGAQAIAAYENSLGGICGRQVKLALRDDQFDSGQNRAQTLDLLGQVFGFLGSTSLFDDAAAAETGQAGLPDMGVAITSARQALADNFSVSPQIPGGSALGQWNYLKAKYPNAITSVGALWADAGSSTQVIEHGWEAAARSVGFNIVYSRGYSPTETDFTADVVRMRQSGVRGVMLTAADPKATARIAQAMVQQGFKPQVVFGGAQGYDPATIALGGTAVEGLLILQTSSLYAGEDSSISEVALMNEWIQKVKPGFKADLFTMFGWAEGRLLFQAMNAAGADLTRANVVAQLGRIHQFDSGGLLASVDPAGKGPPTCFMVAAVKGAKFVRVAPSSGFVCNMGGYRRP